MDMTYPLNPADAVLTTDNRRVDSLRMVSLQKDAKMTDEQMKDIASQFEAMLLRQMLKEMRKSVPQDGYLEHSHATEMYTGMADDYMADQMAEKGSIGIGDMIYTQLKEQNDSLATKEELQKKSEFMRLRKEASAMENAPVFMPLKPELSTEQFLELHKNKGRMIPLNPEGDAFLPLTSRKTLSTARIQE